MQCAADRADRLEKTWLHKQRSKAKAAGVAWDNEVFFGILGTGIAGGGNRPGGKNAERRAEPVLRIAIPTYNYSSSSDGGGSEEEDEETEGTVGGVGNTNYTSGDCGGSGAVVEGELNDEYVEAVAATLGVSQIDAKVMLEQGIVRYGDVCG
jgi:hypothetical protein